MKKIFFGLFILIILAVISAQPEFKEDDVKTWSNNIDKVLEMDAANRNKILNSVDGSLFEVRGQIIEKIGIEITRIKVQTRILEQSLSKGAAYLLGKSPKSFPEGSNVVLQSLKGFESGKIILTGKNTITDGNIEIDLEKLPMGVTGIEYKESDHSLVYTFSDGNSISVKHGKIDENLQYVTDKIPTSKEEKGTITFVKGNGGSITVDDQGNFEINGDAKVLVEERKFEKLDKESETPASFRIAGGSRFIGKNILATTTEAEIKTSKDTETEILFESGKPTLDNYVQIYGAYFGEYGDENSKIILMQGENMEVNLLKEGFGDDRVYIVASGKDLVVKNGEQKLIIDEEKTYVSRKVGSAVVDATVVNGKKPGQEIKTDIKEEVFSQTDEQGKTTETPKTSTATEVCSDLGICYTQVGTKTLAKKAGYDALRSSFYVEENFWKSLPKGMSREEFEKTFLGIPTKVEAEPLLDLPGILRRIHTQYINKDDMVTKFTEESDKYQEKSKFGFTKENKELLLGLLDKNLKSDYPPGSKIVLETGYDIAERKTYPIIRTTIPGQKDQVVEIKDPKQRDVFIKFFGNSLYHEDKKMSGYDPKNGIVTHMDKIYREYLRR